MKSYVENIIAISMIKGIGSSFMKKHRPMLMNYRENIELLSCIGGKITQKSIESNLEKATAIKNLCRKDGIGIITIADDWYPHLLLEIKNPPPLLFYKGNLSNLNKPIAVIGTRKASLLGERIAAKISVFFSQNFSICNGLADGIDRSTIEQKGGVTQNVIGVVSGGLLIDKTLSKRTAQLAKLVLANNGLLVSEFEPNKKEDSFSAIKACRIQAGLSKGIILVQSPISGGSKYTIKSFSEVNRPLGIVSFAENAEFQTSDIFSANRLLVEKGIKGVAEMSEIKKISQIRLKELISISKAKDYENMVKELNTVSNNA